MSRLIAGFTGICGGSASGKTTVAKKIIEALDVQWISLLSMDCFYKVGCLLRPLSLCAINKLGSKLNSDHSACCQVLSAEQHEMANSNEYNFDHPDSFDIDLLVETLSRLKSGKKVEIPVYNFTTHSREPTTVCGTACSRRVPPSPSPRRSGVTEFLYAVL